MPNMTSEEYEALMLAGSRGARIGTLVPGKVQAKARPRKSSLNGTESKYRDLLESRKRAGEIQEYFVQQVTLKLADDCRYIPDFLIIENDGAMTFIEVKGWLREDSQVKFRVAATMFWWAKFTMVHRVKGQWVENEKATRDKRANEKTSAKTDL